MIRQYKYQKLVRRSSNLNLFFTLLFRFIMASIAFPDISRSILLPNGTTYNYVFVESRGDKPFLLFIHGYPSSSYDWRHQIHFFSDLGYGLIVPDLLGYGGTDKPQSLEAYRGKKMSEEINALLDVHKIPKVLGIGHDWYVYHTRIRDNAI